MHPITRFQPPLASRIGRDTLSFWSVCDARCRVGSSVFQSAPSVPKIAQAHRSPLPALQHANHRSTFLFSFFSAASDVSHRCFSDVASKESNDLASILNALPPWQCGTCCTINRVPRGSRTALAGAFPLEDSVADSNDFHARLTDKTVQSLFFCRNCGALCSPGDVAALNLLDPATAFTLFSLGPVRLEISESTLRTSYLRLQLQLHPDRITQLHRENEKESAAHFSGLIAQCYNTLKDPLLRGSLVLQYLKGRAEPTRDAGVPDPLEAAIDDKGLLLEIFEYEEQIAALSDSETARTVLRVLESELADAFEQFKNRLSHKELASAQVLLQRCRMLDNLKHKCSRWLVENATHNTPSSVTHGDPIDG